MVTKNWMTGRKKHLDRKEYLRNYNREWMARRRKEWFDANGGKCKICGNTENLELDHINPELKEHHVVWSWAEERRLAELAKCQILCKECHMKKTLSERKKTEHGRIRMYDFYKCRCILCVNKKQSSYEGYNARRKLKRKNGREAYCVSPEN